MSRRLRTPTPRSAVGVAAITALISLAWMPAASSASSAATADAASVTARRAAPVVLTGPHLPSWSRLPAQGVAKPFPSGAVDGVRDAHNGLITVPPDTRSGVPVGDVAAFRYQDGRWVEVPVQVDERFPYFLANGRSDFGMYSGTDPELTYAWDVESWKRTAGECATAYPQGAQAMPDPVPTLDDDDEVVFMASDAGARAPADALGPARSGAERHEVAVTDPLDPSNPHYVYLFLRQGGSSFDASNGYVRYQRDANADEWIDRYSFLPEDPEKLGTSNTGYGPNLEGTVCRTAPGPADQGYPQVPDGAARPSTDRFPRDGVTVTTDSYRWYASGRWMVRSIQVTRPGQSGVFGPDLVDRWKGRAFQQSPDSSISLVGFEDEQVNWEGNSVLLGERAGPVRAIREVWGADSGTNVTKTETFYRDAITYRYRLRVHPIPPDGIYTSWDYNAGVAVRYYNALNPDGVAIDGVNDDVGNVDGVGSFPAFFDVPDPTFGVPVAVYNWEQVSGANDAGSLVSLWEVRSPSSWENPSVFPYYRDDKCLDDGTGDSPVPRPWPGEPSTDERVRQGYAQRAGVSYGEVTCDQKQGAWASHGLHTFFSGDTDNAFSPLPVTEADIQQWQFAVPTTHPHAVGEPYALNVVAPPQAVAAAQANTAGPSETRIGLVVPKRTATVSGARMTATLAEPETGGSIAGRTVRFLVKGQPWATAATDESGVVAVPASKKWAAGTRIEAVFDGGPTQRPVSVGVSYHPRKGASGTATSG